MTTNRYDSELYIEHLTRICQLTFWRTQKKSILLYIASGLKFFNDNAPSGGCSSLSNRLKKVDC